MEGKALAMSGSLDRFPVSLKHPFVMSPSACQPCDGMKLVNANGPAGVNLWGRCHLSKFHRFSAATIA
jgi:hypothetical protein